MIIIAENDSGRCSFLVDLLKSELKQRVVQVPNARGMFTQLEKSTPELLVFNAHLPDFNGKQVDFIKKVRQRYGLLEMGLIAMVEEREELLMISCLDSGCNDCIKLPLNPALAIARIKSQLVLMSEIRRVVTPTHTLPPETKIEAATPPLKPKSLKPAAIFEDHGKPDFASIPENLKLWIRSGGNESQDECLFIMIQLAKALAYAHDHQIVHRELNSVCVSFSGECKARIHGIGEDSDQASLRKAADGSTTNPVKGMPASPVYAAPEQLLGKDADKRTDIYNFGSVAYEILTGKPPFYGLSMSAIVDNQIKSMPTSLLKRRVDVDLRLEGIIFKCLKKVPGERYQDAHDLVKQLQNVQQSRWKGLDGAPPVHSQKQEIPEGTIDLLHGFLNEVRQGKGSDAAARLKTLIEFLELQQGQDSGQLTPALKNELCDPDLLRDMVTHNLNPDGVDTLFSFFRILAYDKAVLTLLNLFTMERDPWKKQRLGELAVISSGTDMLSLVSFGLELNDKDASVLLKAFAEATDFANLTPVFNKWASHPGHETQKELIKLVNLIELPDRDVEEVLRRVAGGSIHRDLREMADILLRERDKAYGY